MIKSRIRSDCNKHVICREHYTRKKGQWKPKKQFENQADANYWIRKYKMRGYTPYICPVCKKKHIGFVKGDD